MHTSHFPWKLLLNNFSSTILNLVAFFFSFSLFNRSVGSTPSKRYLKYGSSQSSSCTLLFSTSTWFRGMIEQVLQSLCSSLASLVISSQKTPSLYNLSYRPTSRFTRQTSWCNLCNCVSPFCLETHFISNPSGPLGEKKFPLILRKYFIFDGKLIPMSLSRPLPSIKVFANLQGGITCLWSG